MKKNFRKIKAKDTRAVLVFLLICLSAMAAFSQPVNPTYSLSTHTTFEVEIQSIALLDLENTGGGLTLSLDPPLPTEAGAGLGSNPLSTNSTIWINYSSAVPLAILRKVQVNFLSGSAMPSGFDLLASAGSAFGSGGGTLGNPVSGKVTLSTSAQDLITGIGGAFTGIGAGNGHQITYELHFTAGDFSVIENEAETVSVIYTIIDN